MTVQEVRVQLPGETAKTQASILLRSVNEKQLSQTVGDCCLKKLWTSGTEGFKMVCVTLQKCLG